MSSNLLRLGRVSWRRVGHTVGLLALVLLVFIFVASSFPMLALADESYVVRSASMAPTIEAGSVVFVNQAAPEEIEGGDVITYRTTAIESNLVTHRVVDVLEDGERRFRTKGDANEDPDPGTIAGAQVVGVVAFHLPLIGYAISFAGSRLGMLLLVVVPAVALIVLELWDLATSANSGGE